MKLALISAGLFLLSYILVNGGLGPNPFMLIVPVSVAVGSAVLARWMMRRGKRDRGDAPSAAFDLDSAPMSPPRAAPPAQRAPGNKARKLF